MNREIWENHYRKEKSELIIPDENVVRSFVRFIQENPDARILDAGCGKGRHLDFFWGYTKNVYGMDFTRNSIKGKQDRNTFLGDISQIPVADKSFDYVLAWGVLHYLPPEKAQESVRELRRILNNPGRLFLTLRSDEDTHIAQTVKKGDLAGAEVWTYSREAALEMFTDFRTVRYGYIERIPPYLPGEETERKIAHHILDIEL